MGYRLTGPLPIERLCVTHLNGPLRVVVAFTADEAWVVLVGLHDGDPGMNVYAELYALAGASPPDGAGRAKPSCCGPDGAAPELDDDAVQDLVDRARRLARQQR